MTSTRKVIISLVVTLAVVNLILWGVWLGRAHDASLAHAKSPYLERAQVTAQPISKTPESKEEGLRTRSPSSFDSGIFEDLDEAISPELPVWVLEQDVIVLRYEHGGAGGAVTRTFAMASGVVLAELDALPASTQLRVLDVIDWGDLDRDGDGIPNQADILLGALKAEANHARYEGGYEELAYPGGDVSRDKGVCTDMLVRALRNAGIDLQVELHEDIAQSPRSFPMVKERNAHIDHRRVKTLLPYFERQWDAHDPSPRSGGYLPGDVLFMQTYGDDRPDHVGVVSDRLGESGLPLVINNWTDGYATSAMDLLDMVQVTHRFRHRADWDTVQFAPSPDGRSVRSLEGVLTRQRLELSPEVMQVVLVTAESWGATNATLQRFERADGVSRAVGEPWRVRLGRGGLGAGVGEHDERALIASARHPQKQEGDGRSPAGVFRLGTAFGREAHRPSGLYPWRAIEPGDLWVDDPESIYYNQLVSAAPLSKDWESAEDLSMYRLATVVEHNTAHPVQKGDGSAIFLHTLAYGDRPTLGCTAMEEDHLRRLIEWLEPSANPTLVQVVDVLFP